MYYSLLLEDDILHHIRGLGIAIEVWNKLKKLYETYYEPCIFAVKYINKFEDDRIQFYQRTYQKIARIEE